mgnify:CR=1 FL=1
MIIFILKTDCIYSQEVLHQGNSQRSYMEIKVFMQGILQRIA